MVGTTEGSLMLPRTGNGHNNQSLSGRVLVESKKLWSIAGPSIFGNLLSFTTIVITQAFAGHLGDFEFASISVANTVIIGFNNGLMMGMSSALETLCGQAFGAKRYPTLGIYLQRSWITLLLFATLLLPVYIFATPILRWTGQPEELAVMAGNASIWCIPLHYSFAFLYPLNRFLMSQSENSIIAVISAFVFVFHVFITWLFVHEMKLGLFGTVMTLNLSWWVNVSCLFGYVVFGGCPRSWTGFSLKALSGIWDFIKLSVSSGIMICLENWYFSALILFTSTLKDAQIAVDALSICLSVNGWTFMISLAFLAATGVRVSNELGAGDGNAAKFAIKVSVAASMMIGLFFACLIMILHDKYGLIYTSSPQVLDTIDKLTWLVAFSTLLNSVQPVLSGVAIGSGWQATVAYVNIGSYYIIGIPTGLIMGYGLDLSVVGIWSGMIGGTILQTLVLTYITINCDWDQEALEAGKRVEKWGVHKKNIKLLQK